MVTLQSEVVRLFLHYLLKRKNRKTVAESKTTNKTSKIVTELKCMCTYFRTATLNLLNMHLLRLYNSSQYGNEKPSVFYIQTLKDAKSWSPLLTLCVLRTLQEV
jgi:hypothetical protein